MLLQIPALLDSDQVRSMRARLDAASWGDGRMTAGHQSALAKVNRQLPQDDGTARELGGEVLRALERNARFISGTLPLHVFPPLFNRYEAGMSFGGHVDNAIRQIPGTPHRVRTDISATVFLSEPGEYDGGELVIEDTFGTHSVKLAAGDMVVYPSSSVHRRRSQSKTNGPVHNFDHKPRNFSSITQISGLSRGCSRCELYCWRERR